MSYIGDTSDWRTLFKNYHHLFFVKLSEEFSYNYWGNINHVFRDLLVKQESVCFVSKINEQDKLCDCISVFLIWRILVMSKSTIPVSLKESQRFLLTNIRWMEDEPTQNFHHFFTLPYLTYTSFSLFVLFPLSFLSEVLNELFYPDKLFYTVFTFFEIKHVIRISCFRKS